jgi:NADH dehydrogenase FAD-containing subunit
MKHLVLIGDGAAHLHLMRELAACPWPSTHVTWIAPALRHVHLNLLPQWMAGRRPIEAITVPLQPLAQKAHITLIESDVLVLDAAQRQLSLSSGQQIAYDALSINASGTCHREAIAGAREHALFNRPVEHFIRLWAALVKLSTERQLNVVVVGHQVPAIELALAAQQRLGEQARVALVTHGNALLPEHPVLFQQRVKQALKRGQVTLFEADCEAVSQRQMQLGQGLRLACDAPILAIEPIAPTWLSSSTLALDEKNQVLTHENMQSTSHPEVFVAGELAARHCPALEPARAWYPLRASVPALLLQLQRFLAGGVLTPVTTVERGWYALNLGPGQALARMGAYSASGRWVAGLKARADEQFLRRFSVPGASVSRGAGLGPVSTTAALETEPQAEFQEPS